MEKYFNINYEFSPQEVGRRIDEQLSKNESDYICVADGVILNNANRKVTTQHPYRKLLVNKA